MPDKETDSGILFSPMRCISSGGHECIMSDMRLSLRRGQSSEGQGQARDIRGRETGDTGDTLRCKNISQAAQGSCLSDQGGTELSSRPFSLETQDCSGVRLGSVGILFKGTRRTLQGDKERIFDTRLFP